MFHPGHFLGQRADATVIPQSVACEQRFGANHMQIAPVHPSQEAAAAELLHFAKGPSHQQRYKLHNSSAPKGAVQKLQIVCRAAAQFGRGPPGRCASCPMLCRTSSGRCWPPLSSSLHEGCAEEIHGLLPQLAAQRLPGARRQGQPLSKESCCKPCAKRSRTTLKCIGSNVTTGLSTSCLPAAAVLTHAKVAHMATVNSPALHTQVI